MFSGKTEELLRRLRRSKIAGKNVLLIKHAMDDRYDSDSVRSHSGYTFPSVNSSNATNVLLHGEHFDVIGIDEVQFFDRYIVPTALYLSREAIVICSGLDTNFRYEAWDVTAKLMAYAEKVDKLSAVCVNCGGEATKTQRLVNGKPASFSGPDVLVGGLDSYEARCKDCFEVA